MGAARILGTKGMRAAVCGSLLVGMGAVAVMLAPVASAGAQDAAQTYESASVTNLTPYTWTFQSTGRTGHVAPPKSVAPGQTASWDADPQHDGYNTTWYYYDADTGNPVTSPQDVKIMVPQQDTPGSPVYVIANQRDGGGAEEASTVAHTVQDPDGDPHHVDMVWNSPATVSLDAASDQADATAVVNYELPRATAGSVKWTPQPGAAPTFAISGQSRASSLLYNYSDAPATIDKGQDTSKGESTSLGAEITGSVSVTAFGESAKMAASVTGDAEWGGSDSVSIDIDSEIEPGHVGWLDKTTSVATLIGDLEFTTPEGTTFDVKNVAISQGDIIDPHGTMHTGISYMPDEKPVTGPAA